MAKGPWGGRSRLRLVRCAGRRAWRGFDIGNNSGVFDRRRDLFALWSIHDLAAVDKVALVGKLSTLFETRVQPVKLDNENVISQVSPCRCGWRRGRSLARGGARVRSTFWKLSLLSPRFCDICVIFSGRSELHTGLLCPDAFGPQIKSCSFLLHYATNEHPGFYGVVGECTISGIDMILIFV